MILRKIFQKRRLKNKKKMNLKEKLRVIRKKTERKIKIIKKILRFLLLLLNES